MKNILTSVQEVIALSEKPWIVILTGNDELNPASKRLCLFPASCIFWSLHF